MENLEVDVVEEAMTMKRKRLEALERRTKSRTEEIEEVDDWDWVPDLVEVDEDEIRECLELGNTQMDADKISAAVAETMAPPNSIVNWVHLALETKWDGQGTPQENAVAVARGKTLDEIVLDIVGGQVRHCGTNHNDILESSSIAAVFNPISMLVVGRLRRSGEGSIKYRSGHDQLGRRGENAQRGVRGQRGGLQEVDRESEEGASEGENGLAQRLGGFIEVLTY